MFSHKCVVSVPDWSGPIIIRSDAPPFNISRHNTVQKIEKRRMLNYLINFTSALVSKAVDQIGELLARSILCI